MGDGKNMNSLESYKKRLGVYFAKVPKGTLTILIVCSTVLSPLSRYDAIPTYILTIKCLWFAPGLFCFWFTLLDSKIKAPSSSAIFFFASCSFSSIDAMCLTKSDWVVCTVCFSWDSFSSRLAMSLSVPTRVCLGKAISFSLAVNEYCKYLQ